MRSFSFFLICSHVSHAAIFLSINQGTHVPCDHCQEISQSTGASYTSSTWHWWWPEVQLWLPRLHWVHNLRHKLRWLMQHARHPQHHLSSWQDPGQEHVTSTLVKRQLSFRRNFRSDPDSLHFTLVVYKLRPYILLLHQAEQLPRLKHHFSPSYFKPQPRACRHQENSIDQCVGHKPPKAMQLAHTSAVITWSSIRTHQDYPLTEWSQHFSPQPANSTSTLNKEPNKDTISNQSNSTPEMTFGQVFSFNLTFSLISAQDGNLLHPKLAEPDNLYLNQNLRLLLLPTPISAFYRCWRDLTTTSSSQLRVTKMGLPPSRHKTMTRNLHLHPNQIPALHQMMKL